MPTPKAGYHLRDGSEVPGTTGVISRFKDSGPLLYWAFRRGKEGARQLYENTATDIGSHVHSLVEADLHNRELPPFPEHFTEEMVNMAQNGFDSYKREIRRSRAFFMPLEVQLVSEVHRFGGTPDAIAEFEGTLSVVDWKTASGLFLDHVIQLAAYRVLWNETHPDQKVSEGRLFRFSKESGVFAEHSFQSEVLDLAFEQFVLFRRAYDLDRILKKKI